MIELFVLLKWSLAKDNSEPTRDSWRPVGLSQTAVAAQFLGRHAGFDLP